MAGKEITEEELQKGIAEILENASLDKTSTKKVIQKLEKKLGVTLTDKKKLIDQLVMDYVNNMDSDESLDEEEEVVVKKKKKKVNDDEEEERDDSNDSDWGDDQDHELLCGSSEHNYSTIQDEPTTTQMRHSLPGLNQPKKGIILKRVSQQVLDDDECDIFGKLTAKKLRRMPEEQKDLMMIHINQLFYDRTYHSNRPTPVKTTANIHQDHFTITPTIPGGPFSPTQIQAKKIYRVKTIPNVIPTSSNGPWLANNIPTAVPVSTSTSDASLTKNGNPRYSCNII